MDYTDTSIDSWTGEWEEEYRCPKCDPYDINEGLWTPNKPY